jgi:hypothetical protein
VKSVRAGEDVTELEDAENPGAAVEIELRASLEPSGRLPNMVSDTA